MKTDKLLRAIIVLGLALIVSLNLAIKYQNHVGLISILKRQDIIALIIFASALIFMYVIYIFMRDE